MSSAEFEMFKQLNLFDLFDGKTLDEAIVSLKSMIDSTNSSNCKLKVVNSEIGLGVLMYLAIQETSNCDAILEQRKMFFAEKNQKLIDDNRAEWENLRQQFTK